MSTTIDWRARSRRLLPYAIAAASGFLLAYLVAFFFLFPAPLVPDDREVPDVGGLPYATAAQRLEQAGFAVIQGEARFHATAPEGTVLAQRPPAGARAAVGSRVTLDVSRGQMRAQVPELIGLPRHLAELAVTNAGLRVSDVRTEEHEAPRGEVIAVDPPEGDVVPTSRGVRLVVSAGPAEVTMPDVVGQPYPQARVLLDQLGLRMRAPRRDSTTYMTENIVLSQSPGAGEPVRRGALVSLVIAGGAR